MFYFIIIIIFESITMCLWLPGRVKGAKQPCLSIKFTLRSRCPETCRSQIGRLSARHFSHRLPSTPVCTGDLAGIWRTKIHVCSGLSLRYPKCYPSYHPNLDFRFYLFHFSVCFESLLWGKRMLEDSLF